MDRLGAFMVREEGEWLVLCWLVVFLTCLLSAMLWTKLALEPIGAEAANGFSSGASTSSVGIGRSMGIDQTLTAFLKHVASPLDAALTLST